ncbi:hypothetical protein C5167_023323 [Papaver somniferum]|uniref:Uncharacterized protein n=1 Tax=Papaver somniferum TaxID=3469 RepID=A0A4Y7JNG5_PAPSO|nr:hypothetical protein C5167_023323 [Papaver somniferum]
MGRNEVQSSIPNTNDIRGFRRLRKAYPDYRPHCVNRDAGFLNRNVTQIPDAMSEKVGEVARRSQCLFHKNYNFVEECVCASSGGFIPGLAGNRESTNSGSSNDDPGFENESSEDVSSGGPPNPFLSMNAARVPLGREAMRGNDFSNTVFIDDSSPSRKDTTRDNGEKVTQSSFPIGLHVLSDHGLLGSGSTNPRLTSENVRVHRPPSIPVPDVDDEMVRRPPLIPVPDVDGGNCPSSSPSPGQPVKEPDYESMLNAVAEHYTRFMNSVAQLNEVQKQRALEGGVDAGMRREITRLQSENAELTAAISVLTEELAGVRQKLADSNSSELQLKLTLDEIRGVLPASLGY